MYNLAFVLSLLIQFFVLVVGIYFFSVSIIGCVFKKEDKREPETNKIHKFALVVAAYNEEAVIDHMVDSLNILDYPKDAYEIFVIADNCSDNTAKVAREHGATVFERSSEKERGKGYALEWMFSNIFEMDRQFDAVCVFDADNVADRQFLNEMNKEMNKGYKVIQGYIDTKNPYDSWITMSYAISFWTINRLYQYARYNLGMCCQLCGTGFAISTEVLKEIGWGATCLAEDMEFTMKLSLHNQKVSWAHRAVVYDEKPITLSQSWKQRMRWMQGHADCASRFFWKLIKKGIKERDFYAIDCAIYLVQPVRLIALGIINVLAIVQNLYPDGNLGFFQLYYLFSNPWIWNIFVIAQLLYLPIVLCFEGKMNKYVILNYIPYMAYSFTWIPLSVMGVLKKNQKEWFHTQHTRKIAVSEIEN